MNTRKSPRLKEIEKGFAERMVLAQIDYTTGEPIKALRLLLSIFETSLSFASRIANMHELSIDQMKNLETELQAIYEVLGTATLSTGLHLKDAEHAEHPLKLLWDQWAKQKEKVTEMAEWFLQK